MGKSLTERKYYVRYEDFEKIFLGQAVLQISQISRSCVVAFMSY